MVFSFHLLLVVVAGVLFGLVSGSRGREEDLVHSVEMDQFGNYIMRWTPAEDYIEIQLEVATRGYVGLGISPTGGMAGADMILGWVDDNNRVQLTDRYATGDKTPLVDPSQDVTLLFGRRNETHTTLRFRRPWTTCDGDHDVAITSSTTRVLWAYDHETPPHPATAPLPYHDHRGVRSLFLRGSRGLERNLLPPDALHWDVRAPQVSIPSDVDTLYWCKLYKMPDLPRKHHYIGYEPLIAPGMVPHVHHMILYECHTHRYGNSSSGSSADYLEQFADAVGAQCYAGNMPDSWNSCNSPIVAWAVGAEGFFLPEHAGFPLGEEFGGASYFMLEIHYNNPDLTSGLVDSSGLRLHYTPHLRRYDAATLQLGHAVEPFHIIPPGRVWDTTGHCTAACTRELLPPTGIHVFSAVLHSHVLGRGIILQHIRGGKELPPIAEDLQYDFNYQQERVLEEERTVLPGDHLIVTCRYDSRRRPNTTYGGFKTTEEMCLVFAAYYPRQLLSDCFSRPDLAMVLDTIGVQDMADNSAVLNSFKQEDFDVTAVNRGREADRLRAMDSQGRAGRGYDDLRMSNYLRGMFITAPPELNGTSLLDLLDSRSLWQQEPLVQTLQERLSRGQYEPYCFFAGRRMPSGMPRKGKYPAFVPYIPPTVQCTNISSEAATTFSPGSFNYGSVTTATQDSRGDFKISTKNGNFASSTRPPPQQQQDRIKATSQPSYAQGDRNGLDDSGADMGSRGNSDDLFSRDSDVQFGFSGTGADGDRAASSEPDPHDQYQADGIDSNRIDHLRGERLREFRTTADKSGGFSTGMYLPTTFLLLVAIIMSVNGFL